MTMLPPRTERRLGLVIDLDTCVGCHACAVSCKEWNTGGYSAPLSDESPYGPGQSGTWLNRVHTFEARHEATGAGAGSEPTGAARTVHFPRSCLHCADAPCVTVCPTGASYKRAEDGIVLVDEDLCIGCKLCSWACPYGAREYDAPTGVMKKCTLCVDRIYNENLPEADRVPACVAACPARARHFGDLGDPASEVSHLVASRSGFDLMPELELAPTNKYLPPRTPAPVGAPALEPAPPAEGFLGWLDRVLGGDR
jgi:Fe-S-cluster-containing dehydrogenase component